MTLPDINGNEIDIDGYEHIVTYENYWVRGMIPQYSEVVVEFKDGREISLGKFNTQLELYNFLDEICARTGFIHPRDYYKRNDPPETSPEERFLAIEKYYIDTYGEEFYRKYLEPYMFHQT